MTAPAPARGARTGPDGWTLFHVAAGGMILTYVWRMQQVFPAIGQLRPTIIFSLLALGLFLARPDLGKALKSLRHPSFRYLALLYLWMILSIPTSVYQGLSFRWTFIDFIKTILFAVLIAAGVRSRKDLERLLLVHLGGGIVFCAVALLRWSGTGRIGGAATYDPNDFGMVLVSSLPIALYFVVTRRHAVVRLVALAAVGIFLYLAIETTSRGALLGLLAVGSYLLYSLRSVRAGIRIAVVVVAAITVVSVADEEWKEQMGTLLNPTQDYNWNSDAGRLKVWQRGMGFMLENPITGVGVRAYAMAEGTSELAQQRARQGLGMKWSVAHNSFVQVAAELGIPGLCFFVLMIGSALLSAHRTGLRRGIPHADAALGQALSASLIGFVVTGFFLSAAWAEMMYLLIGYAVAFAAVAGVARPAPARVRAVRGGEAMGRRGLAAR